MAKSKIKLSYSDAIKELEEIVASMNGQEVDINLLPEKVKRGSELVAYCRERLRENEETINKLLEE